MKDIKDTQKRNIGIVVPVYNEERALHDFLPLLSRLKYDYKILFIDDGSSDRSADLIEQSGFDIIRHPYNKGYGASLKTGIRNMQSEYIVIMDSDAQHDPEFLEILCAEKNVFDMIIGARDKSSSFPLLRRPGKMVLNLLASYSAGFHIKDINSGLRVFRREDIIHYLDILPNGFSFTTTITLIYIKAGYSIKYIPITALKRKGKSSVRVSDGFRTMLLILKTLVLFNPMRFFLPISLLLFFTGIGELYYEFWLKGFFNVSTSATLILLSSLLVFLFGLVSEQISMLRRIR
ncbi:MAG: glycosyltransferase family 2 protein [Candidatus Muiribacteriaceae bacterium]